ncbi:MAG: hypothetical protein JW787_05205 [Sedimentisphaerales bacterium]|nr:hypothetical protein [Sedimentisphaerales bacterium]
MTINEQLFTELKKRDKSELNIVSKKLKIHGVSRLSKSDLIERLVDCDQIALKRALELTWWDKHHNAVYGWASIIGVLLTIIFFLIPKLLNDKGGNSLIPMVAIDMQFPYERNGNTIEQNKRNPRLTVTNSGPVTIAPISVDVDMFTLDQITLNVSNASELKYRTHGHLLLEPELKPGSSINASLVGVGNWSQPAAYRIKIQTVIENDKLLPLISLIFLIDKDGIKGEGSSLSTDYVNRIKTSIKAFERLNQNKRKLVLYAPVEGVWIPTSESDANFSLDKTGTLTVK